MVESRKIVRVFLASPGDLQEERRTAKLVVDEFNNNWADHLGYHVELVGWEDTVSVFGRPQATINRDLERCELFIGMIWKRWGTPPDNSGRYSSGFEEEFETSISNRQSKGSPEISLFFKEVGADLRRDPGEELKKVLAFKEKIITEKSILFETFSEIGEFREKIQRCVSRYVQVRDRKESGELTKESKARTSQDSALETLSETKPATETLLSVEGTAFLREMISRTETGTEQDRIAPAEAGRFRLLASIIGNEGNDEQLLGVHDANILFAHRSNLKLSARERHGLIDSGLEHYSSENTPLWYWLAEADVLVQGWLQLRSLYGSTASRVGALSVMRLISEPLVSEGQFDREACMGSWFLESAPSVLKVAALGYLAECGTTADLTEIKAELEKGDSQTIGAAVDATLRINLREGRENAILALIELQPGSINSTLLATVFDNSDSIDTNLLSDCLTHKNSDVRRIVVKLIRHRGALDRETATQLVFDSDAGVRFEALQSLIDCGKPFSDEQAKSFLVIAEQTPRLGFLGAIGATDRNGEAYWDKYCEQQFAAMNLPDLERAAYNVSIFNHDAEFALFDRQFSKFGDRVRADVDDHFEENFAKQFETFEKEYGESGDIVEKVSPHYPDDFVI